MKTLPINKLLIQQQPFNFKQLRSKSHIFTLRNLKRYFNNKLIIKLPFRFNRKTKKFEPKVKHAQVLGFLKFSVPTMDDKNEYN